MKPKGRKAWLVSWEGYEFDERTRCKIVAVLPPQFGERQIQVMLPFLYCATYSYTLDEKLSFSISQAKSPMLRKPYTCDNVEITYGVTPKEYLSARQVKDLRAIEEKNDRFDCTLFWTELPKYRMKDDNEIAQSNNPDDWAKEVVPAREKSYRYSTRDGINQELKLRRK